MYTRHSHYTTVETFGKASIAPEWSPKYNNKTQSNASLISFDQFYPLLTPFQPHYSLSCCQNTERTPQTQQFKQDEETEEQRNTQQIKEQDKCPPNQTKEEEVGNLPDKEV